MATNLDRPENFETWIGHPHGLRLRRHPGLAAAEKYVDEFPMVIRTTDVIESSTVKSPSVKLETLPAFRQSSVGLTVEMRVEIDYPSPGVGNRLARLRIASEETELHEHLVLRPGKRQVVYFPFPEFTRPTQFQVRLEIRDEGTVETRVTLQPEKKWTIHIAFQTHLDLGWTDRAERVIASLRQMTSEDAVRLCREFAGNAPGQRFVWTCECSEALRYAWEGCTPGQRQDLLWCIREGLIECCVLPFSFHTNLMSRDLIERAIRRSFALRKEIGAEGILDLSVSQQNDVPGQSWVLPDLLAGAGVHRAVLGHNWLVKGCPIPPLFRWRGPDGGEVLTLSTSCMDYGGPAGIPQHPRDLCGLSTNSRENTGTPGTAVFKTITYGENCGPAFAAQELGAIQRWQREFVWPRLMVGGPRHYFDQLEAEVDIQSLPVVDREISDWWLDGPASMPAAVGQFRRAMRLLPRIAPAPEVEENLILFAEHTFGLNAQMVKVRAAANEWRVDSGFDEYIGSWEDKEAYARKALEEAQKLAPSKPTPKPVVEGTWQIDADAAGITRLVDPTGYAWVDSGATPEWARFGSVVQQFVPRETGSWFHHDLPFAPHQGRHVSELLGITAADEGIDIHQRLVSPAGAIGSIKLRLQPIPGTGILRGQLVLEDKQPTAESETLALSMPFRVSAPGYAGDVGGRSLRVDEDQLPDANRDEHAFDLGWILSDQGRRLAVSSPDVFLWHFGGLRHCRFNRGPQERTGEVYAHLFNNAWQTNFRVWLGGRIAFEFFLKPLSAEECAMEALTAMAEYW